MAPTERSDTPPNDLHTRFLCAFIEVPVLLLDFKARCNYPREVDNQIKARLSKVFSHNFEPSVPNNHVAGVVTEGELESILSELQMTKEDLRQTIHGGNYPRVQGTRIWCPADRHRVEAATELFGNQITWIVQLHCPPGDIPLRLYEQFIRALSERYSPQYSHSDGEIFRNIRRYQSTRPELVGDWLVRLSASKKISLNLLFDEASSKKGGVGARHRGVLEMFDRLLMFPGLWEGLELGNLHKHLALRCNDEVVRYLEHIGATWDWITGSNPELQSCVDIHTARSLQSLAPAVSWADRDAISMLLTNKKVFGAIQDPHERDKLQERLLRVDGLIPTIKSFHENMKLFSITAKILRTYLLPERSRAPLFEYLAENWSQPTVAFVEFAEGSFQAVSAPPSFKLAYIQLFCAVLRNFPELSDDVPKVDSSDKIRSCVTFHAVSQFYRRVALLGFWNDAVQQSMDRSLRHLDGRNPITLEGPVDTEVMSADRRRGRPYTRVFRQMRQVAFLPQLQGAAQMSAFPTVEYIVRDFLRSFLGTLGPELRPIDGEIISIASHSNGFLPPIPEECSDGESDDGSEVNSSRGASPSESRTMVELNADFRPAYGLPAAGAGNHPREVVMTDSLGPPRPPVAGSEAIVVVAQPTLDIEMKDSVDQDETTYVTGHSSSPLYPTSAYPSDESIPTWTPLVGERPQDQRISELTPPLPSLNNSALRNVTCQQSGELPPSAPSHTAPSSIHCPQTPAPSLPNQPMSRSICSPRTPAPSLHVPCPNSTQSSYSSHTFAPSLPGQSTTNSIYFPQTPAPSLPKESVPSSIRSPQTPAPSLPAPRSNSTHSSHTFAPSLSEPTPSSMYSPRSEVPSMPGTTFSSGFPLYPLVPTRPLSNHSFSTVCPGSEPPSVLGSSFSQWSDLGSFRPRIPSYVQPSTMTQNYESSRQGSTTPERSVAPSLCHSGTSSGDSMVDVQLSSRTPSSGFGEDWASVGSRSVIQSPRHISQLNGFVTNDYWEV